MDNEIGSDGNDKISGKRDEGGGGKANRHGTRVASPACIVHNRPT